VGIYPTMTSVDPEKGVFHAHGEPHWGCCCCAERRCCDAVAITVPMAWRGAGCLGDAECRSSAAIRFDPCLCCAGRCGSLRRELSRNLWRKEQQAGGGYRNADTQQHFFTGAADAGRHVSLSSDSKRRFHFHLAPSARDIWSPIWMLPFVLPARAAPLFW
jgi:hypothetical protein